MTKQNIDQRMLNFSEEALRGSFASLFWAVIIDRRSRGVFTLQSIADALGINKSTVSRWFSGDPPNWESNTIAAIAEALEIDLRVEGQDRNTGAIFTPSGIRTSEVTTASRTPDKLTTTTVKTHTDVLVSRVTGATRVSKVQTTVS